MAKNVPPVALDSVPGSAYDVQFQARVQYVVSQVMTTHAGAPENEVMQVLVERLRGIGVNVNARQAQQMAAMIAGMPKGR